MHRGAESGRIADLRRSVRERFWIAPAERERAGDDDHPPVRWQLSRRAVLASLVVALLSCAAAVAWVLAAAPRTVAVGPALAAAATSGAGGARPAVSSESMRPGGSLKSPQHPVAGSSSTGGGEPLVVDVIGRVRRPGVYRLPPGARVDDAIKAAGGIVPGANSDSVNLARRLADGEQIAVGVPVAQGGDVSPGTSSGSASGRGRGGDPAAAGQPLDLNTATAEQLDSLPGVGPALAQRIVEFRQTHGRFGSVDELKSVSGIGDAKFNQLRPRVTAG